MRLTILLAAAVVASPLGAQSRVYRADPSAFSELFGRLADQPRAVIGITTTSGATSRDTLGVLVGSVRAGSPAEKAGIEEGNRIAAINGVSLKLAAADVGEYEMAGAMTRRLTRELDKVKPGDEVELRVYANGQTKTVRIKTIAREDSNEPLVRRGDNDRATLGISIGLTGSKRDSLGVFVMGVDDNGPAAKAGMEEGNRIASINGVDLRGRVGGDDDEFIVRSSRVNRLERELAKVKPGDDVELRVYSGNQARTLKVKTARASDLPRSNRGITIMRGDSFAPLMVPPIASLRTEVPRATVERAFDTLLPRFGNRVSW